MSVLDIVNLENFRKVFRNIRKVGLVTTVRYVVSDLLFDLRYKIDTIAGFRRAARSRAPRR